MQNLVKCTECDKLIDLKDIVFVYQDTFKSRPRYYNKKLAEQEDGEEGYRVASCKKCAHTCSICHNQFDGDCEMEPCDICGIEWCEQCNMLEEDYGTCHLCYFRSAGDANDMGHTCKHCFPIHYADKHMICDECDKPYTMIYDYYGKEGASFCFDCFPKEEFYREFLEFMTALSKRPACCPWSEKAKAEAERLQEYYFNYWSGR